jgi:hypothetical protein
MKNVTTTNTDNLTPTQEKAVALLQHLGEPFFVLDGEVYQGSEEEAREQFKEARELEPIGANEDEETDFAAWCVDNLTAVDEYDTEDYNNNYLVLTDEEAEEKVSEEIENSLWAFRASFILGECGLPYELEDAIQSFQEKECEGANDAILALVEKTCGLESFVKEAVRADGRGHFLNRYDGNENEETVNGTTYFIYRQN